MSDGQTVQQGFKALQKEEKRRKREAAKDEEEGFEASEFDGLEDEEIERVLPDQGSDEESEEGEEMGWCQNCCLWCYLCITDLCQCLCFCLRLGFECPLLQRCHPEDRQVLTTSMTGMILAFLFSYLFT